MKILGAALAAALLITGPALAQGIENPSDREGSTSGMGVEGSAGGTQEDVLPAPAQPAPDGATGGTQETVVPGAEEGGMDGATPQDGDAGQVEPYSGSQSQGEFGSPAESGSSVGTESDLPETAIPEPGTEKQ